MPWLGGLDYKLKALRWRQLANFIAMSRDRDTGVVYQDPQTGGPMIDYSPSAFDRRHLMEGIIAICKMCYVTGATEIRPCLPGVQPFVRTRDDGSSRPGTGSTGAVDGKVDLGIKDPTFAAWLETVRKADHSPPTAGFGSAHQMGTCRMSTHDGEGVVDPKGKVWGTDNLYVADASVFPSASGVNPMVTNMAIADWISRGISKALAASVSN
jgi:hypothetical protein